MPNGNDRGNTRDRAARRLWILTTFGDGTSCPCAGCGVRVDIVTLVVDRIVPGCEGGRYTRDNIQPHCRPCSDRQGGVLVQTIKKNRRKED